MAVVQGVIDLDKEAGVVVFFANAAVILILAIWVLLRGPDRRAGSRGKGLRIAGLIPLGLQAAFFLMFAVGEMAGGDLSGAGHLLQFASVVLEGYLGWLRPQEGGILLILVGLLGFAACFSPREIPLQLLILSVPQLLSGVLLTLSRLTVRRSGAQDGMKQC